jgi:hypothetical protein
MAKLGKMFVNAPDETSRQVIVALYRGLRYIDFGLDLAFDFFFFSAWMLLGYAMLNQKYFGKVFGTIGIILFGITSVLNIWSAPNPPNFEMAPIVLLWILAVYIQMLRKAKSFSGAIHTEAPTLQ